MKIKEVKAESILAGNGKPTIQVTINKKYTASTPEGSSTGEHEVNPLPTTGITSAIKFLGQDKELKKLEFEKFEDLEQLEDYQKKIGGNGVLALQYAVLRGLAGKEPVWKYLNKYSKTLPIPLGNVIGGGRHTKLTASDFQEFLLIPRSKSFTENALANDLVWKEVRKDHPKAPMTYEGAIILQQSGREILDYLKTITLKVGKQAGFKIDLGLDIAATSYYLDNVYKYKFYSRTDKKTKLKRDGQIGYVNHLIEEYNLKYVEDPVEENDATGFGRINQEKTLVCGDDLITTNLELLKKHRKHVNAVIIKPNQIGSITKAQKVVEYCHDHSITPVISHRSGETTDDMISHLAVAWEIPYAKIGIYGKERRAKIRALQAIERQIGKRKL